MAIIQCPVCGQEISDKAKKCIYCGTVFVEEKPVEEERKCSECGTILAETDEICPKCGCPVEKEKGEDAVKSQQEQVTGFKMTKKTRRMIQCVIVALLICVVGGIGYKIYLKDKEEKEYRASYNTYVQDLETAQLLMIDGGSKAESLCNLTLKVWGDAIYERYDIETEKYTRPNGSFVDDFNKALSNLYADSDTQDIVTNLETNQALVKEIMKNLQNPPEGLDRCYDTVSDLYEAYKTLTDLAISPSGNYNGFSTNKSDVISDFMSAFEKLDNQIPEKLQDE